MIAVGYDDAKNAFRIQNSWAGDDDRLGHACFQPARAALAINAAVPRPQDEHDGPSPSAGFREARRAD
jgi:hypothetical protein